jgi:hypothetical protein
MTFLRSLRDDLIEKRLWPIALLLLLTAIAVPVLLGRGSSDAGTTAPLPIVPAQNAEGATPAVQIVGPAAVRARAGKVRDPFRRAKKAAESVATEDGAPAAASTSKTTTTATADAKTGGAAAPKATTSTTTTTPTTTTTTTTTPVEPSGPTIFRARVRWGADATADTRGISRLEPLGGTSNPALLYLGTTADHKRAVFLLGPNAAGDDKTLCADTSCRVIALKAGESIGVGVVGSDGAADRSYELGVTSIPAVAVADKAAALARVHSDGREVLRAMIKDPSTAEAIGQYTFDRGIGAVVPIDAP